MGKLFDICHECQQHNSELKPLEPPFLSTDDLRFLWLKYQVFFRNQKVFEPVATGEARDENLELDEPVQCRKKYKQQCLLSSKFSNSHYIGT